MAKMFYTSRETQTCLGVDEERLNQLGREGLLREFRDGPQLMYKADQVEAIKHRGFQIAASTLSESVQNTRQLQDDENKKDVTATNEVDEIFWIVFRYLLTLVIGIIAGYSMCFYGK